jgi:two-component system response regulator YesN
MEGFIDTVYAHRKPVIANGHLLRATAHILQHYREELTLSSVADAVYVSDYYLSHLFRRELNMTFSDYVCRVRIGKAREILQGGKDIRIQEITEQVGFNDPNYFSKSFKKITGMTPKKYQSLFR